MPVPQAVDEKVVVESRIGGYDPLVEGTPESRRAAHAEQMRELRVSIASHRWHALSPDQVEFHRFQGRDLVVETDRGPKGKVFMLMHETVWPHGDPKFALNEDLVEAVIVGHDVTFLKGNDLAIASVEAFEQMREDVAYLDRRKQERKQEKVDKGQAALRAFREAQPLREVTLGDLERREMPTVRAAARLVLDHGGSLKARDGGLRIGLPEKLSPHESEDEALHEQLRCAATVLFAAANVIVPVLESRSKKPLDERLPDKLVLAGGGLA